MKKNANHLLSVIVPVYSTEKTLPRCLDSILNCTYSNIELIVVDDCSPDNAAQVISAYAENDSRIQSVKHEKNKGLFLARMTGVAHSHGKYIAFLDSDDYVSVDFYRRLIEKAETTDSDMVMGEVRFAWKDKFSYYSFAHSQILNLDLHGHAAADLLFRQAGKDPTLHMVCNKIYRRDLWERCQPYFAMQKGHLVMCENVLFSALLYYFVVHMTNIHGDFVYYEQGEESIDQRKESLKECLKNISDIQHIFMFLEKIFQENIKDTSYLQSLKKWRGLLKAEYVDLVQSSHLPFWNKKKVLNVLNKDGVGSAKNKSWKIFPAGQVFQKRLLGEELKEKIQCDAVEVISFDIFDTLVFRPFWEPTDLFYLVGIYANELLHGEDLLDFKDLRITAEKKARKLSKKRHPNWEEITLDDIYHIIQDYLGISAEQTEKIKQKEIEIELRYCHPRSYAKELFELCQALGKKIVITSDMYLPKKVIEKILAGCGYTGYEKLYLSSEIKLGKWSGHLFQYICKNLHVKPKNVLHIGDTMASDVNMAKKIGLQAVHFPKAVERFMNVVPNLYGGELFSKLYGGPFALRDGWQFMRFFGWKCLLAVAANKVFANPYVQFHPETDFNADPTVIGTLALGPHMFAVGKWLADEVDKYHYDNLNFMARDGYLPQLCFNEINRVYKLNVRQHYLYLTRSVMLPLQISNSCDFLGLVPNFNIFAQTPDKIFEEFKSILSPEEYKNRSAFCQKHDFIMEKNFSSLEEFYDFIRVFKEQYFHKERIAAYKKKIYQYLEPAFQGKTATFDVGYSCRVESILKRNYGFDVTPYYIHVNNHIPFYRAQRSGMDFHTFYQYSPGVTGIIRELLISKQAPSCDTLEIRNGKVEPVFKSYHPHFMESYMVSAIQDSAVDYVKTVVNIFDDDIRRLYYQREDVSLAFEYYSTCAKLKDRQIFSYSDFEDDLGLGKNVSTFDFWNSQIENVRSGLGGGMDLSLHWISSKWKRAICLYFIDRDYLKYKVKTSFSDHPIFLSALIKGYKGIRCIYNVIKR